jgi:hypothetical protein
MFCTSTEMTLSLPALTAPAGTVNVSVTGASDMLWGVVGVVAEPR